MSAEDPAGAPPEMSAEEPAGAPPRTPMPEPPRYGRYVGLLAIVILVLITINTIVTKPNGGSGFSSGQHVAPFAVPLALGSVHGDANLATRVDQGSAGAVPACRVRRAGVLNICQLYERSPVVLTIFVDGGSCTRVLSDMQALRASFPGVRFAAVAIKGERSALRRLIRTRGLTFPVGIDSDGALAVLYKVASCPQVSFVLPGGVEHGHALLTRVSPASLRARVEALVAAARAQGWRPS
jgi:hypothetical protein